MSLFMTEFQVHPKVNTVEALITSLFWTGPKAGGKFGQYTYFDPNYES